MPFHHGTAQRAGRDDLMGNAFRKVRGVKVKLDAFYCALGTLLQILAMQISLFLITLLIYSGAHRQ